MSIREVFIAVSEAASSSKDEYVQFALDTMLDHAKSVDSDIEDTMVFVVANLEAGLEEQPNSSEIIDALAKARAYAETL
jgi:hypothetical protein